MTECNLSPAISLINHKYRLRAVDIRFLARSLRETTCQCASSISGKRVSPSGSARMWVTYSLSARGSDWRYISPPPMIQISSALFSTAHSREILTRLFYTISRTYAICLTGISRHDDIKSARQRSADAFESLAPHNYRFAHGDGFEPLQICRQPPRHIAVKADYAVLRDTDDLEQF